MSPPLNNIWNKEVITEKNFKLKLADVTSVLKKQDASLLRNYRPVSVLPVVFNFMKELRRTRSLNIAKHLSLHLSEASIQRCSVEKVL